MPPFVNRKRDRSGSSQERTPPKRPTLFDAADQAESGKSFHANRKLVESLDKTSSEYSSDPSSDEFEDVQPRKRRRARDEDSDEEEEDDELDWEDALTADTTTPITPRPAGAGELELTLTREPNLGSLTEQHGGKKGPSKIERQIRVATHQVHVQFLLFHFSVRNGWACDKRLQKILLDQLPNVIAEQVKLWRSASALPEEKEQLKTPKKKPRGRPPKAGSAARDQRDWGSPAIRQEKGVPNMSGADPIFKLLKDLVIYWKRTFRITAPSLRKQGYKPMGVLQDEVASFHSDSHDPEEHGEKIDGRDDLRQCAKKLQGSRDIGALLFTALLRGIGIEAKLVASLQPVGFGWGKGEDAALKKRRVQVISSESSSSDTDEEVESETLGGTSDGHRASKSVENPPKPAPKAAANNAKGKAPSTRDQPGRGAKNAPITLDDSSELSDAQSISSSSVQELKQQAPPTRKPNAAYDRDMTFPNCWVEAVSPVTNKVIPVDPVVSHTVASNDEHLVVFEARGSKAEKAKQVLAYVVAYSSDGTAKDVTTRYLKRHMWPGRTKGVRIPMEKIARKDGRGKVKSYMHYDWFKRVMAGYARADNQRTAADDIEDATDLKAVRPEKKRAEEAEQIDTLQGYKQSAHYVLERFMRREEALLPGSEPVRTFAHGKGASAKEELVYRRRDVVACKTAESWHKEGREIQVGQQPLKSVAVRAVTLARRIEVEAAQKETGVKPTQGMYARDQTQWIVPPPIENGVIPKNAYGTIDCFVPSMVPAGSVHVPYRGTAKACKKLGFDYAEAVTGFEFGNRRAVPVLRGVVVAEDKVQALIEQVRQDEEQRQAKEDGKREKAALATWKKFLMGLRIVEKVREEYGADGHEKDETNPFTNPNKAARVASPDTGQADASGSGGFIPDDAEEDEQGGGFTIE